MPGLGAGRAERAQAPEKSDADARPQRTCLRKLPRRGREGVWLGVQRTCSRGVRSSHVFVCPWPSDGSKAAMPARPRPGADTHTRRRAKTKLARLALVDPCEIDLANTAFGA